MIPTRSLVVLLAIPSALMAADSIVSTPAEFQTAVQSARPGDAIVLKDGKWTDADLTLKTDRGMPEQPITVRAQTPGKVVLTGKSRLEVAASHVVIDGLYFKDVRLDFRNLLLVRDGSTDCRITSCAFVDCNPSPDARKISTIYLELQGTGHRVDHCYFAGKRTIGQTLVVTVSDKPDHPNHDRIDHNHFGPRPPLGENGGETIRVGLSQVSMNTSQAVVEENLFDRCDGEIEVISNKSCDNVYRHNVLLDCAGTITLRHGNRCLVDSNVITPHGKKNAGGIRVIGEDHTVINNYLEDVPGDSFESAISLVDGIPHSQLNEYFQVKRAVIAFNTVIDCKHPITIGSGHGQRNRIEPPTGCVIASNVVTGRHAPLVTFLSQPVNMKWQGNLFYGSDPGVDGAKTADPKLERSGGFLLPAKEGPAAGAAEGEFPRVTADLLGRPRCERKDVGCFQVSSDAAPAWHPVTAADVGPQWLRDRQ